MDGKSTSRELKSTSYELFILLISILSLFNLLFLLIPGFDQTTKDVVRIMDGFITLLFMADFLYRFFTAESKTEYFFKNWGWADLLASLPVQQLKIFRVFRIIKVFRLLREFGLRNMLTEIRKNRAGSALYLTVFMVLLVLEFGGVAIVSVEASSPDANITNASDAVWWAFVTITTVGYGDQCPVTNNGRLLGMFVMVLGVSLFGVLTGFLANRFLSPQEERSPMEQEPAQEKMVQEVGAGTDLNEQIKEFRKLLNEQEKTNALLKARFKELEKLFESP
jgi:voltage-gated potassium channel